MKKNHFLIIALCLFIFSSCKKESETSPLVEKEVTAVKTPICFVSSQYSLSDSSRTDLVFTTDGKLSQKSFFNDKGVKYTDVSFEYTDEKIIVKFSDANVVYQTTTYSKNSSGMVKNAYLYFKNGIIERDTASFEYSTEGYLQKIINKRTYISGGTKSVESDTTINIIIEGNVIEKQIYGYDPSSAIIVKFEYYKDKLNNIDLPLYFYSDYDFLPGYLGKKTTNLIKSFIVYKNKTVLSNSEVTYLFDNNGRITKATILETNKGEELEFGYKYLCK